MTKGLGTAVGLHTTLELRPVMVEADTAADAGVATKQMREC